MAVITIARELGSWSENARQLLVKRIGGTMIDKSVIDAKLKEAGVTEAVIERYDERKPGFFASFSADQDTYIMYLRSVMLEAAVSGSAIIIGRSGNIIMGDVPGCLRVRLVAPIESRVNRVTAEYNCDEATARRLIRKSDEHRAGFCRFHFDARWDEPSAYDLTINTSKVTDEHLVEFIAVIAEKMSNAENDANARRMLQNRLLAQKVASHILLERKIPLAFLDAVATSEGRVILRGAASTPAFARQAGEAAMEVPGVTDIENRIQVAIELSRGSI